jgi:hypothetical protein
MAEEKGYKYVVEAGYDYKVLNTYRNQICEALSEFNKPNHYDLSAKQIDQVYDVLLPFIQVQSCITETIRKGKVVEHYMNNFSSMLEILLSMNNCDEKFIGRVLELPYPDFGALYKWKKMTTELIDKILSGFLDVTYLNKEVFFNHKKISVDTLVRYHNCPEERVRRAIARNKRTPPEILAKLLVDRLSAVRRAAIKNPNCPKDADQMNQMLVNDKSSRFKRICIKHVTDPEAVQRAYDSESLDLDDVVKSAVCPEGLVDLHTVRGVMRD